MKEGAPADGPAAKRHMMSANQKRVVMLVKNSFEYDARVEREARTLVSGGWEVTIVALHDGCKLSRDEVRSGFRVHRVSRIYGSLARIGPASTVVASPQVASHEPVWRRLASQLARLVMPVARIVNDKVVNKRMIRAAERENPAFVHAHDLNTLAPAVGLTRRHDVRVIYDSHELNTQRAQDGCVARWYAWLQEKWLIGSANAVITSSNMYADYLEERYSIGRPTVLRNIPEIATPVVRMDLRRFLGIDSYRRILIYQGSVQRGRGIGVAISALGDAPGWDLVVVGYGAGYTAYQRQARKESLGKRVHFVGPVPHEDLLGWTAGADVGLCLIEDMGLSYRWSLPNKLFEYVAAGLPVICSDFGEMGKFVREKRVGELCSPAESTTVGAALNRLMDPQHLAEVRMRAEEVGREHQWETEGQVLLDIYDALANGDGHSLRHR